MLSYDDAIKFCSALNRMRTDQHEVQRNVLVRNLNYTFTELVFEFDDLHGYRVTHSRDPVEDSAEND